MRAYQINIASIETGESIYVEESTKAADLKFYVEQALSNNCYVEIREPEKQPKKVINFTELLKKQSK